MTTLAPTSIPAAEIAGRFALSPPAKALLRPAMPPHEFLAALVSASHFPDAIKFVAHALPKRDAIVWGLECCRPTDGTATAPAPPIIAEALRAVQGWLADPSENNRLSAKAASDSAGLSTPAGCMGLAVFFSGGSLAPPKAPVVPPGEFLTAHAAACAVMMAAVAVEPQKAPDKYRRFIELGKEIAARPRPAPPPPQGASAPRPMGARR